MKRLAVSLIACVSISGLCSSLASADDVDNTKQNKSALNGAPTAENQTNDKTSLQTSAQLRKAIMGYKGLSMDAQNVKIIDNAGCLTLRGIVDSAHEKEIIGSLAKKNCGSFKNELEIKNSK